MDGEQKQPNFNAYLLGGMLFTIGDEPIHLPTKAAQAVLVFLLHQPRLVPRDRLIDLFFQSSDPKQGAANLRATLSRLKKAFGPYLTITRAAVGINAEANVWVDSERFAERMQDEALPETLALYAGDFLAGFALRDAPEFEQWMVTQQERLRVLAINGLQEMMLRCQGSAEFTNALSYCEKLLAIEPLLESVQHAKLLLLARTGQRALALRHYSVVQQLFADELGVPLSAEMTATHKRIAALPEQTPSALPPSLGPFVGREGQLGQLRHLLAQPTTRLITLLGAGGMGKTRLAQQTARQLLAQRIGLFLDGLFFVPLAGVTETDMLPLTIAKVLQLTLRGTQPASEQLLDHLRKRETLLILDNFEQLVANDAAVEFVAQLLAQAPAVKLIVTSRERLNLYEETIFDVAGLALPETLDMELAQVESVALFLAQAARQRVGYAPDSAELSNIATLCRLLDGIPLAIELAAGSIRQQSLGELIDNIQESYAALATRFRNVPSRHRSLRSVFDHSWRLLSEAQQALLAALSVFPDTFSFAAVQAVADADRQAVAALIDRSLVQHDGERLLLHGMVREFSAENLASPSTIRAAHANHYTAQTVALSGKALDKTGYQLIDTELANLRAAWTWWLEIANQDALQRLIEPLFEYFNWSSRWQEGIVLFEQARLNALDQTLDSILLLRCARFYVYVNSLEVAKQAIEHCIAAFSATEQPLELSKAYSLRGRIALLYGAFDEAIHFAELGLRQALLVEDEAAMMSCYGLLGSGHKALGQFGQAKAAMEQALALCEAINDEMGVGMQLNNLGNLHNDQGEYAAAITQWTRASEIFERLEFAHGVATVLSNAATAYGHLDDQVQSEALTRRSIVVKQGLGNKRSLAYSYALLGDTLRCQARFDESRAALAAGLGYALAANSPDALVEIMASSAELLLATKHTQLATQLATHLISDTIKVATRERMENLIQPAPNAPASPAFDILLERLKDALRPAG